MESRLQRRIQRYGWDRAAPHYEEYWAAAQLRPAQGSPPSFDAVLCSLGLMYAPQPLVALREMRRVLRPGGRAVVAVWGTRAHCGWADIFPIVDRRVDSEVCPMFFQLGTGESLRLHLDRAGFTEVQTSRISTTLSYDSPDDALGAAFTGGPVAMAYSRFDESTRREVHAEYLESIAPFSRGDGYAIPGEFVVARGVLSSAHS